MSAPVLLVTGGSRGIGAAVARLAAQQGYDVALTYVRDGDAAERVAGEVRAHGRRALTIRADAGREEDVTRTFAEVDASLGALSVLVYNSAITGRNSRLDEAESATIRHVLEVNVLGAMLHAREAVRRMSTKHGGRGGSIVFLSSRAALYGSPGEYVWYAASKGAIDSLTAGLAREVGREGIRVNAVSPGPIDTDMQAPGRLERVVQINPMGRAGTPEEAAQAVLFLASAAASYVNGANISVSGGV
ncbi:MAG: SDR family oxidoreductase [Pseudomonadota bacterium]|jgi:Dehydrogenases with different specificities (related to short-chain alcohol dehydrogenases)|nr:MAG: NAD(P)-dependent oxidoreductase [Pseudomonadota bacterium]